MRYHRKYFLLHVQILVQAFLAHRQTLSHGLELVRVGLRVWVRLRVRVRVRVRDKG